jgi:signal transduction histidine kinase
MLTRLYMLRRQPERLEDHLAIADQLVNNLKILIYDLQLLSRIERNVADGSRMNFSLSMLMEKVIRSTKESADRKGITLNAKLPPTPINLVANFDQLDQALRGLLAHVVHFCAENVTIDVICRNTDQTLQIDIYDPGEPINEALIQQIFHPFIRRSNGVDRLTGLELAIAESIIQLHGGEIIVESLTADEQNSFNNVFRVTLPLK